MGNFGKIKNRASEGSEGEDENEVLIAYRASEGSEGEEEKKFLFAPGLTKEEFQKLQTQAASFKEGELRNLLNLFLEAENKMKYSPIPQLPLELAIIESCGVA